VQQPPPELLALVGPDAVATHRRGLDSGAWLVRAATGDAAVAVAATPTAAEIARIAGQVAVGPAVLGVADGWVLTESLVGPRLTPLELSRPQVLRELAALLANWHRTPPGSFDHPLAGADLLTSLRAYAAAAGDLDRRLVPAITWAEQTLEQLAASPTVQVACHLDVGANVIATPRGLRLIDFDYAALADPAQELGQLVWEAELDRASTETLVAAYAAATCGSPTVSVAAAATWCVAAGISWTVWAAARDDERLRQFSRRSAERLASHWARPPSLVCG